MNRWHVGCLLLLIIAVDGCQEVAIPACDTAVLALQNPANLSDFTATTENYGLRLTNTAAPPATFVLSSNHYTRPIIQTVGQKTSFFVEARTIKALTTLPVRRYPNCTEPFAATASAPMTVLRNNQRHTVTLSISYVPNTAEIAAHERYLAESQARQRQFKITVAVMVTLFAAVCVGGLMLVVWIIRKLMKLF